LLRVYLLGVRSCVSQRAQMPLTLSPKQGGHFKVPSSVPSAFPKRRRAPTSMIRHAMTQRRTSQGGPYFFPHRSFCCFPNFPGLGRLPPSSRRSSVMPLDGVPFSLRNFATRHPWLPRFLDFSERTPPASVFLFPALLSLHGELSLPATISQ